MSADPGAPALLATIGPYATPPLDLSTGLPEGLPADATPEQQAYATRLLDTARAVLPAHPRDGEGDVEDFWENAARLDAALSCGASQVLVENLGDVRDVTAGTAGQPTTVTTAVTDVEALYRRVVEAPAERGSLLHWGPIREMSPLWLTVGRAADLYATTETFARHAGRRFAHVGFALDPADPAREAKDVMAAWAAEGMTDVVIKTVQAKHGIWRLTASTDPEVNRQTLFDAIGWNLVHNEGDRGAYLLQQAVPMAFEYRLFVVDGRVITGAGCIEEHTPLYADHSPGASPFDPRVRRFRSIDLTRSELVADAPMPEEHRTTPRAYGTDVTSDPVIVERLVAFGSTFAIEAAAEGRLPRACAVDVALNGATGQPLVIEVNGLSNSGLYASKPALVTHALINPPSAPAAA